MLRDVVKTALFHSRNYREHLRCSEMSQQEQSGGAGRGEPSPISTINAVQCPDVGAGAGGGRGSPVMGANDAHWLWDLSCWQLCVNNCYNWVVGTPWLALVH